ncbi:MAG: helix-turn-helix transcriptional regulator [Nostocoides sp.]
MSAFSSPAAKTERLLNLVMCLLYTRRPLPKSRLRQLVPQYADAPSDEAFDRMFERDKDELRELGIPLVVEDINGIWEDDTGYVIHQRDYALPDVDFTAAEQAALGLAARVWAQASLAGDAATAIRKLRADGVEPDDTAVVGIEPRLHTTEPSFDVLRRAVTTSTVATFEYSRRDGHHGPRRVQPWGLASWHGRWYLTGYDLDRADERVFRLSRIDGPVALTGADHAYEVPQDHDVRASIGRALQDRTEPTRSATVHVRPGRGQALVRRASSVSQTPRGESIVTVDMSDLDRLADELAGYGGDVLVVAPPELRDGVITRLRDVRAANEVSL